MNHKQDTELQEYRQMMVPPEKFEDGFGWRTMVGAVFVGFLMVPGSMYMFLVAGQSIGPAARWVTVILFMEVARRSLQTLKQQEVYVLYYMAGHTLASPFQGLIYNQFLVQSPAAKEMGVAQYIPNWVAPSPELIEQAGNTFLTRAWLPAIGLLVLGQVIARVDHFGLSYVLFRITSDVEKLPFPLAPVGAAGAVALAETGDEKRTWRWRTFSIGSMIGMVFGTVYFFLPSVSSAVFGTSMQIIPIPWWELTQQTEDVLPAVAMGINFDLGNLLIGMVIPFWAVIGGFIGFVVTAIANPVLYHYGLLHSWHPGMNTVRTIFANYFDFYLSFQIGLALAIAIVGFYGLYVTARRARAAVAEGKAERGSLLNPPPGRGDFSFWIAIGIYVFSTLAYIFVAYFLLREEMQRNGYEAWIFFGIFFFYGFVYTPILSYATARLEGLAGQAIAIPFVREATFILSGYKGVGIWFAPIPIHDYGRGTVGFREIELTGTSLRSIIRVELFIFPILMLTSVIFSEFLWRMGPIPSENYPFVQQMWDLQARQQVLLYTSTLEADSPFLEALNPIYVATGGVLGLIIYAALAVLNLPTLLIYGVVRGLGQSTPHAMWLELTGALVGRFYFRRKFGKRNWLQYVPVLFAGYACGMGLIGMGSVSIALIAKSVSQLQY